MEITEDYVTMLTPEGEFLRARHEQRQYELGEEILFFPLMHEQPLTSPVKRKRHSWRLPMVSFVAAAMLLLSFIPYYMQQQVYAYMSIDINPSLELGVNRQFEVVEVHIFNEEAKTLLKSIEDWDHKPVQDVTSQILKTSEQQGYLKREKKVFIATVFKREKRAYKEQLLANIRTVTKEWEQKDYKIETAKSSLEIREKAEELGISTGTWLKREKSNHDYSVKPAETSKHVKPKVPQQVKSKEYTPLSSPKKVEQPNQSQPAVLSPSKGAEKQMEKPALLARAPKQQDKPKPAPIPKDGRKEPKSSHPNPPDQHKEKRKGEQKEKELKPPRPNPHGQHNEKRKDGRKEKEPEPPRLNTLGKNKEKSKGGQKEPKLPYLNRPGKHEQKPKDEQKELKLPPTDSSANVEKLKQDSVEDLKESKKENQSTDVVKESPRSMQIQLRINVLSHTSP
jgi:hypothetical protein